MNVPLLWPKNSDSTSSFGIAPQLTAMKLPRATARLVDRLGEQFLARTRLALDQNGRPVDDGREPCLLDERASSARSGASMSSKLGSSGRRPAGQPPRSAPVRSTSGDELRRDLNGTFTVCTPCSLEDWRSSASLRGADQDPDDRHRRRAGAQVEDKLCRCSVLLACPGDALASAPVDVLVVGRGLQRRVQHGGPTPWSSTQAKPGTSRSPSSADRRGGRRDRRCAPSPPARWAHPHGCITAGRFEVGEPDPGEKYLRHDRRG